VFELMLPALVASLILLGLHGYLGIHIIARGVIFVDLALAQVAAMGWAAANLGLANWIGNLLGIPTSAAAYSVGLLATLIAAGLFSISRLEHEFVPQEALIGIVFVVASAGTILLAAQAPRGSEHVEELLTGSLLWVTWPDIARLAVVYTAIGIFHWIFRDRFLTISLDPAAAREKNLSVGWWDFLFYALFGVMVTLSVAIVGVLLVFSFLVIPAVVAFLFTKRPGYLLALTWTSGTIATFLGLFISYQADLPTGPVVVCSFALVLIGALVVWTIKNRRPATGRPAANTP
jgi:zinc/manganese transport system permease protein